MTATFFRHGEGRSINGRIAESEGRHPLSRAKKVVAEQFGCTQVVAAAALELLHDGEWHHVGKYAAEVNYYDSTDERLAGVVAHILACGGAKKFSARREQLIAARRTAKSGRHWVYSAGRILAEQERRRSAERGRLLRAAKRWSGGEVFFGQVCSDLPPNEQARKYVRLAVARRLLAASPRRHNSHDSQIGLRLARARELAGNPLAGINRAIARLLAGEITWKDAVQG